MAKRLLPFIIRILEILILFGAMKVQATVMALVLQNF